MALKSTIYKVDLGVADIDRGYYADHALTVARHPSETDERMMVRLLAFALHADAALVFCRGISDTDQPDLWQHDLTGTIERWIDLGQPDDRRIAKACGRARQVYVFAYGGQTTRLWWQQIAGKLKRFTNLTVFSVSPESVRLLGQLVRRTMRLQATIQEGQMLFTSDDGSVPVELEVLVAPP